MSKAKKVISKVWLGYQDEVIQDGDEGIDFSLWKVGGNPDWISFPPPKYEKYGLCKHCSQSLFLLVQVYAPLKSSCYDRTLYVLTCRQNICLNKPNSVRVIRGLKFNQEYYEKLNRNKNQKTQIKDKKKKKTTVKLGSLWSSESQFNSTPNKIESQVEELTSLVEEKLKLEEKNPDFNQCLLELEQENSWPKENFFMEGYYMATELEDVSQLDIKETQQLKSYQLKTSSLFSEPNKTDQEQEEEAKQIWVDEVYENTELPYNYDVAFQKFCLLTSNSPGHILRYSFNSTPLLYSLHDKVADQLFDLQPKQLYDTNHIKRKKLVVDGRNLPRCEVCGVERVFECQVMPSIISLINQQLKRKDAFIKPKEKVKEVVEGWDESLDFGTILIFTCPNDCLENINGNSLRTENTLQGYFEDLALIQFED